MDFAEPQMSVTPGQSVVFYDGDVVLAGAIIEKPVRYARTDPAALTTSN